ncbi:MAG: type II secretion system protein GspM [Pseudomonadota bacterium]
MKAYWQSRSLREQVLIGVMLSLFLVLGLFMGVYQPMVSARENAEARLDSARDVRAVVDLAVASRRGSQGPRAQTIVPASELRTFAASEARALKIAIVRLEPGDNGSISLWIDAVDPQLLFTWVARMKDKGGIEVLRSNIRRNIDATSVKAQIVIVPGVAS